MPRSAIAPPCARFEADAYFTRARIRDYAAATISR